MQAAAINECKTFVCDIHGEYTSNPSKLSFLGLGGKPYCPICKKEEEQQEYKKIKKQIEIQDWQKMNIEKRFFESSFDNFNAYNSELAGHLGTCCAFADYPTGKLVMIGENGNGKTHLAISILKKLGGKIYTAYEIGLKLRKSYAGEAKEWEIFNELCTVPLLVIDEVEKVKDSESKQHWFSYVVGKRYDKRLPIIFIANCHTKSDCKEVQSPCPKCLEYHLENDVLSRIIEDGIIMKFNSKDYRAEIRAIRLGE
ncbi:MAG: ATP-binding protein [Spirochaetaceae bacterium]|nr:ATP-binding protein [Spirochaetaceae bacterium]